MEIGEKIRKLRIAKGITQAELARRAGWMPQRLNHLERGRRTDLHVSTLRKIAAALGVKPGELL